MAVVSTLFWREEFLVEICILLIDISKWLTRQNWRLFLNSHKSSHGKKLIFLHKRSGQMVRWVGLFLKKAESCSCFCIALGLFFSFPLPCHKLNKFLIFARKLKGSFYKHNSDVQTNKATFSFAKSAYKNDVNKYIHDVSKQSTWDWHRHPHKL